MFLSTTTREKWGAGQGRITQSDKLFTDSLHDTTISQGREDGCMDGWIDEEGQMKEGEGFRGKKEMKRQKKRQKSAVYLLQRTGCTLTNLYHDPSSLSHTHKHSRNSDTLTQRWQDDR